MLTGREQEWLTSDSRLFQSPDVMANEQGGITILMCLRSSRFHTLDEVGSLVWRALFAGRTTSEVIAEVAQACDASADHIANDIKTFLRQLHAIGLVSFQPRAVVACKPGTLLSGSGPGVAVRCPSMPWLIWQLTLSAILLRLCGLKTTLNMLYRCTSTVDGQPDGAEKVIAARLSTAASWTPLRTECLEQSLALLWMLRRQGVAAHLRIGVQPFPFFAHAWVEHRGMPVNDTIEKLKLYRPFPILGPVEG
jgi:hypothetical protein